MQVIHEPINTDVTVYRCNLRALFTQPFVLSDLFFRQITVNCFNFNKHLGLVENYAIERKTDDQEGLKAALERYRSGVTTNDLEVNFY